MPSLFVAALSIGLAWPTFAATSNDAFALFDTLCVSTNSDLTLVERMARAANAKPIPPEMLNLDQATAEYGGKGFIISRGGAKYSVMVTRNRGCSVLAVGVPPAEIRRLLQTNYPLGKPEQDSSGTQNITLWPVVAPSRYQGGLIMLNVPKPGFGVDDALSIGFLPRPQ